MSKRQEKRQQIDREWLGQWQADGGVFRGYSMADGIARPWASYITPFSGGVELFTMMQMPDGWWRLDEGDPGRMFGVMQIAFMDPAVGTDWATAGHELVSAGGLRNARGVLLNNDGFFSTLADAAAAWEKGRNARIAERMKPAAPRPRVDRPAVHANLFKMNRRAPKRRSR